MRGSRERERERERGRKRERERGRRGKREMRGREITIRSLFKRFYAPNFGSVEPELFYLEVFGLSRMLPKK